MRLGLRNPLGGLPSTATPTVRYGYSGGNPYYPIVEVDFDLFTVDLTLEEYHDFAQAVLQGYQEMLAGEQERRRKYPERELEQRVEKETDRGKA